MRGRSTPGVLVARQQVFDAVVCVEGIDRAGLVGELLPALCALAFTVNSGAFCVFGCQAILFRAAVYFMLDGAVSVDAEWFAAQDALLVEYG